MHGAKQGGLQAIWGIGFKMILVDRMESEINWVEPSNDEYDVTCSAQEAQEGSGWLGSSGVGGNWCRRSKPARSTGVQHCVCGFLIPTDISLQVPKHLPGPNPESHELPWEEAVARSIIGELFANKPLCDLPVLQHQLHWEPPNQSRGMEKGRGGSRKLEQSSSAQWRGLVWLLGSLPRSSPC